MTVLLILTILAAVIGGICAFAGHALIGFTTLAAVGLVWAIFGFIDTVEASRKYQKDQATPFDIIKAVVICLVGVGLIAFAAPKSWAAIQDWRIANEQTQQETPPPEEPQQQTVDLTLDMDQLDLEKWLENLDPNWRTTLRPSWDHGSMPSEAEARREAVAQAGGKFEFPVSTPMQDLEALLKGEFDDAKLKTIVKGIQKKIITDPLYADQFVQLFEKLDPIVLEQNPWLAEYKAFLDEVFGRTDSTQKGINGLLNNEKSAMTDEVFYNNVRVAAMLDFFTPTGVEALKSSHNWYLPMCEMASDTRIVESSAQEESSAVILVCRFKGADGKEGDVAFKIGLNVWDKRAEIFNPKVATPPKTPTGTGNPGDKTPDKYNILVIGYEYGTNRKTVVLSQYTHESNVANGTSRTIKAPAVNNYTVHPGYETVTVKVNGEDAVAEFFYDRVQTTVKTYDITVRHLDRATGQPIYRGANVTSSGYRNGTTNRVWPLSNAGDYGYRLCSDQPAYQDVTIRGEDGKATFYYEKAATDHSLYYQRGYYDYYSGKWVALDKTPIYVGEYAEGEDFSFRVKDPSEFNTATAHFILQDSSRVTGSMPGKDHTVYVPCDVQRKLDISYKKVTDYGSVKAFEPHIEWITEGRSFRVWAPELEGYYAAPDPVEGTMTPDGYAITVFYYKNGTKPDGGGAKVPQTDPVNTERDDGSGKSNAEEGGGSNLPTDGTGDKQGNQPPLTDYNPGQNSGGNTGSTGDSGNGNTGSDNGGQTTVTGGDKQTSGEKGDHTATDPDVSADDGGKTHGGSAPDKPEGGIPVQDDTTVTTTTPNSNGGTTTTTEDLPGQNFDGEYGGGEPT